eukprot:1819646-Rhodomonas_salina.1
MRRIESSLRIVRMTTLAMSAAAVEFRIPGTLQPPDRMLASSMRFCCCCPLLPCCLHSQHM